MRILFLIDYDINTSGGTQTSVNAQKDELERQGHTVVLLCPAQVGLRHSFEKSVYYLPSLPLIEPNGFAVVSPLMTTRYIRKLISKFDPFDVIHCHSDGILSHIAAPLARQLQIPLVQSMHGRDDVFFESSVKFPAVSSSIVAGFDIARTKTLPRLKNTTNLSRTAKNMWSVMMSRCVVADAVTIPSKHLTELFIHHGLEAKKVYTISNGLKDSIIDNVRTPQRTASVDKPLQIMWAGRVSHEKQPLLFLEMLTKLSVPFAASLYGEGDQLDECKAYISSHNLSAYVSVQGKYAAGDIIDSMIQQDVLVYTSNGFDNQPMVLFEAAAAELPVVFCDPKLAEGMPAGGALLTTEATSDALAEAIMKLHSSEKIYKDLKVGMRNGKDFIRQSVQTKKMVNLYTQLVEGKDGI